MSRFSCNPLHILDKRMGIPYNINNDYQIEEDVYPPWTPAIVALDLIETTIAFCSNTDVEAQPVQKRSCTGCVFCHFI